MKILLIDDHVSFCEGLIAALTALRKDYQVDFEADAELVPQSLLGKSGYDLFIMDLTMPGLGGEELIKYLNKNRNDTPILVISSVQDVATVRRLLDLGIVGYIPKSHSVYQIIDAIEYCREGNIYVPEFIRQQVDDGAAAPGVGGPEHPDRIALTRRQIEIVSLMDKGLSNQEIADTLSISKATVKTYLGQLFRIFNANNRVTCLRAAKKSGLLVAD
jgi:DNA-binding NarL/FixJ family response regulator